MRWAARLSRSRCHDHLADMGANVKAWEYVIGGGKKREAIGSMQVC